MKHYLAAGLFVISSTLPSPAVADDEVALRYAQEAADALRADFDRLQRTDSVTSAQLQELESDLHNAELTVLRLKGDDAGIKRLLESEVDRQASRFRRLQSLAERGYTGTNDLSTGELRLLSARLTLARHSNDQAGVSRVIRRAIEIEESTLRSLLALASRGYVHSSSIAKQKLRIAQLIATRTITLPPED